MALKPNFDEWLKPYFKPEDGEKKQMHRKSLQVVVQDSVLLWLQNEKKFLIFSKTAIPALRRGEAELAKLDYQVTRCDLHYKMKRGRLFILGKLSYPQGLSIFQFFNFLLDKSFLAKMVMAA